MRLEKPNMQFRILRLLQAAKNSTTDRSVHNHLEQIWLATEYAEPGYTLADGACVVVGDWNDCDEYDRVTKTRVKTSNIPSRLGDALEAIGCELEWCDEWSACSGCGKAVRTQPDGFSWTPSYKIIDDCELYCLECAAEYADDETDESETEESDETV